MPRSLSSHVKAHQRIQTPLGPMTLARSELGVLGAWFDDQRNHGGVFNGLPNPEDPLLNETKTLILECFQGHDVVKLPRLDLIGTAFEKEVWHHLGLIQRGTTCTYGAIARAMGAPKAYRAVGAATGRNPLCVLIPCHRVVAANGSLGGYAGGLDRKRFLLKLEQRA